MRRLALRRLAGAVMLLTSSCMVGPNYRGPPESSVVHQPAANGPFVSGSEAAFADGPVSGQWWRLYKDPVLDGLVQEALKANTDLRVAAANIARAQAILRERKAVRLPETSIEASGVYGRPSAESLLRFEPLSDNPFYNIGIDVSYQLDLFGKLRRGIEAGRADVGAAQAAFDLARITVAAETARAYVEACAAGHEYAVAERVLHWQEQSLELTVRLVRAGRSGTLDVTRAQALVDQSRADLPVLKGQKRTALFRLAVLTGQPPANFPAMVEGCEEPPQLSTLIPVGDGAALLRRRPDIREAERRLAAATARIGIATAELYPDVRLGASVGSTGLMRRFGYEDTFRWEVGPMITWTFPNTSVARARIAGANAEARAALAEFDGVVLNALFEVESGLTMYARDLERFASLKAARDRSEEAARDAEILYQSGREGFLPVLDAQRTLATSEASLALAESRLAFDQISVFLALGGGWETPPEAPPSPPGSGPTSLKGAAESR